MQLKTTILTAFTSFIFICAAAQKPQFPIAFKTGTVKLNAADAPIALNKINARLASAQQPALVVLQFHALPDVSKRRLLDGAGVQLLDYLSQHAFTALMKKQVSWQQLQAGGVTALFEPSAQQKTAPQLWPQAFGPNQKETLIGVWVRLHDGVDEATALASLKPFGPAQRVFAEQPVYALKIAAAQLKVLALNSMVAYVQPQPPPAQPLLQDSRTATGAGLLQADAANGGRGLRGEGVVIGIGDNGDVQSHIDFSGRLINRAAAPMATHATHVHGIAAGGGLLDERYTGFAPRATIISQLFGNVLTEAGRYVRDYGMVITNNSYGNVLNCAYNGVYDFYAAYLDAQAFAYPSLLHVFAAGNSGANTCPPFAQGFGTVLGSYQSAKNVLSVGNVNALGQLSGGSSRGPVADGRIKPEIVAMGEGVLSTWTNNQYRSSTGTSMAAPAAAGGLALLYQRYRQLHGGANPANALMKALVCNGASDLGNPGPDYSFGFGYLNLNRSLSMLEAGHYIQDSVRNGEKKTHTISVPAGMAQLKVMLYWNDPAPAHLSRQTLVHDLDLAVSAGSARHLPFLLSSAAAEVNNPATTGTDHINNIEQVVIKNPGAGEYSLEITGTAVAMQERQAYTVVYDFVPGRLQLLSPVGGSCFDTSETIRVQWEAAGFEGKKLSLQFSADDGATWQTAAAAIAADSLMYRLKLPAGVVSTRARVKLLADDGSTGESNAFCMATVPRGFSLTAACEGYLVARWRSVAGASGYEVLRLSGNDWQAVASVADTAFTFAGLEKDSAYAISVRAIFGGFKGRRCAALIRTPSGGNCTGSVSDGDLKLDSLLSPVSARQYSLLAPSENTLVSVRVKNLDNQRITGFRVKYSADGGQSWVSEDVAATIAAQGVYTHHFTIKANLSQIGGYPFIAVVQNLGMDRNTRNDTLRTEVRYLPNEPIDLATSFLETFDHLPPLALQQTTLGIKNLERFDFISGSAMGRLRTHVDSGMAYSGSRALVLDLDRERTTAHKNYLQATFNLSPFDAARDELRCDFFWAAHGMDTANRVWVRGSETDPWVPAFHLREEGSPGVFRQVPSIRLSHLLQQAGQRFSATTQIRWEQTGTRQATLPGFAGGYSIDNLRLYRIRHDVQLLAINTPAGSGCGMGSSEPLEITLSNGTGTDLPFVPVQYSVNGGAWEKELVPELKGNDTLRFTFAKRLNLDAPGTYLIKVVAAYPSDEVPQNDTLQLVVNSQALVHQFPYLQQFEGQNDGWYAEGRNSSWALGTPATFKMSRAASGKKAWKTNLTGNHNNLELSYLYSPCLQTGILNRPTLSFQIAVDVEQCPQACDSAWVEYSSDGTVWTKLDGQGTTWYAPGGSWHEASDTRWHVATVPLPVGIPVLRLRFVFASDAGVSNEGIAIDDVHVYDNQMGIYTGPSLETPVRQHVSGQNWVHFTKDGRLIASVHPKGNTVGPTGVRTFIHEGPVRFSRDQYYHNRSLTLEGSGTDSLRVRFYFTDLETNLLLQADGCAACAPVASVIDLGVSAFHPADTAQQNGTIEDNKTGFWRFTPTGKAVLVPFDAGYYLEFDALPGGEFWLNSGGLDHDQPMPVKLVQLSAKKAGEKDALLQWEVTGEDGVLRYDVQVARGPEALNSGQFETLGQVAARGGGERQQYSFTDTELPKWGIRYYRLQVVDQDGGVQFSPQVSLRFNVQAAWQVFPNPSEATFYLMYELPAGEWANLRLTDVLGRLVKTFRVQGSGQSALLRIDLSEVVAPGVYLLHSERNGTVFRLLKQEK